ncbi:glycosyltransferase [Weissella cibaria]|nr:glycosyltransferase [Weissella cibaria]
MTKKILIVTQSEGGGLRRHLTDLMDGLIEQNFEVVLAYNEEFGDDGFKRWLEIKKASQSLILYNVSEMKRSISPLDDFLAIKRLMQIIRDEQPDIVHTHSSKAGVVGRIAAKLVGHKRVFYTPHAYSFLSGEFDGVHKKIFVFIEKILSRGFTTKTFNVSESEKNAALEANLDSPEKFKVILNAVPKVVGFDYSAQRNRFGKNYARDFLVVNIARVTGQKNPALFVDIATNIKKADPAIHFAWVGKIDSEYEQMISNQNAVDFIGEKNDTNSLVGAADLFLSTSLFEGLSYSLLEAASFGVPVFLSDVPGNSDFADMYSNAKLFSLQDTLENQSEGLSSFINGIRKGKHAGDDGLELSYDHMIRQIIEEYFVEK